MSDYPLKLAALPLALEGGERTRYFQANVVGRVWPVSEASALLPACYIKYKSVEVALAGDVSAYVMRRGLDKIQSTLQDLLKKLLFGTAPGHQPEPAGAPGDSVVDQNLSLFRDLFTDPSQFDPSQLYFGTFRKHLMLRSGVVFQVGERRIGHVLIRRNVNYDMSAWQKAMLDELKQYSEAPGYESARKVLEAAPTVFERSYSGDLALWINQDVVLPELTKWAGYSSHTGSDLIFGEVQLCDGVRYHHPFRSPVFGDTASGNLQGAQTQNAALTAAYREYHASYFSVNSLQWRQPSVGDHGTIDGNVVAAGAGGCSILAACLSSETSCANVGWQTDPASAALGSKYSRTVHSYQPPHDNWQRLLVSVWPDLAVVKGSIPLSTEELTAWHKQHIKLDYRDAQGELGYSPDLLSDEDAAGEFIKKAKAEAAGKFNLTRLSAELGNTPALYSYCVNEALGEFDTWSEGEFTTLLWDAAISWANHTEDIDEGVRRFCKALHVPVPSKGKLSLRGGRHFVVSLVDFSTASVVPIERADN